MAATLALLALSAAPAAVRVDLDIEAVDEALTLARTGTAAVRARFHEAYRIPVSRAPVDYIEVVSPFRRIVLAAQQRAAAGDRSFGQRQALELVRSSADRLDLHVEMTFDPRNTLVGVPEYEVMLTDERGRVLPPAGIDRLSRWTPRFEGLPQAIPGPGVPGAPRGQPLVGATVIARFDLERMDPEGRYELTLAERNERRAQVRVDLSLLR
jgi:hypothetical protein